MLKLICKHIATPLSGFAVGLALVFTLVMPFHSLAEDTDAPSETDEIHINVTDGDIRDLIKWVAQTTGRNFIIDPRVKARVTVVSHDGLSPDEVYQVFISVLQVHGFTAVEGDNNVTKILPDSIARQSPVPIMNQDHPATDDLVIRILKPRHIAVNKLLSLLRPMVPQSGHLIAYQDSNALIIADRAANIHKLTDIISRIDQAGEQDIEVIELKFASAGDVVKILKALLPRQSGKNKVVSYDVAIDERTNSILLTGQAGHRQKARKIIDTLDRPEENSGNTQVIYLHYMKSREVSGILKSMVAKIKKSATDATVSNAEISIESSESTNALVLTAPPSVMQVMISVIRKLDIRRAQVLVEAIIVEVKDGRSTELGVQWDTNQSARDGNGVSLATRKGDNSFSLEGDLPGLRLGFFQNGSLTALVKAMSSSDDFNILSTPNLVTLDNEEARIVVGQNVPFVTGKSTGSASSTENPFQTIERRDVGTKLSITPRINGGDAITLKVQQEISSVTEDTAAADLITDTRSIDTSVLIRDGDILVLGGLIKTEVNNNISKVPLLGDIPLLGQLFTSDSKKLTKRNLMLFIKPTIIKSYDLASQISQGRYRFIQQQQERFGEKLEENLRWRHKLPQLPDLEQLNPEVPITFTGDVLPED
ncbi:MAG: type II secretion system secretin GspD [Endozoicomonas sp.]